MINEESIKFMYENLKDFGKDYEVIENILIHMEMILFKINPKIIEEKRSNKFI